MSGVHFANLSNGVLCAPPGARMMRLQSTWCEQKRWADILWTTPPDFYVAVADGEAIVVHDQSERARLTRAQWQGLSMLRYVMRRTWGYPPAVESSRGGHNLDGYWRSVYLDLPERAVRYVRYFGPGRGVVNVAACPCPRMAARVAAA